jgi:hypothetical protein
VLLVGVPTEIESDPGRVSSRAVASAAGDCSALLTPAELVVGTVTVNRSSAAASVLRRLDCGWRETEMEVAQVSGLRRQAVLSERFKKFDAASAIDVRSAELVVDSFALPTERGTLNSVRSGRKRSPTGFVEHSVRPVESVLVPGGQSWQTPALVFRKAPFSQRH